jgi:hypothetical protein
MLRLAHVRQSRSSSPLLAFLYDLNALHIWRVNLEPHLDTDSSQFVSEEDCTLNATAADVDANTGKGVAVLQAHEQDVTQFGGFWAELVEESGTRAGWVEDGDLGVVEVENGVWDGAGFRRWRRVGFELSVD